MTNPLLAISLVCPVSFSQESTKLFILKKNFKGTLYIYGTTTTSSTMIQKLFVSEQEGNRKKSGEIF